MQVIGFTSGYFDIMHPGHVMMLKECTQYCDHLIVAVNEYKTKVSQPDGRVKSEPIWTPEERLLMVKSKQLHITAHFLTLVVMTPYCTVVT